ncbi:MAG TPA: DNA polymerase III subunit delta [Anaerolineaceae bacterium]|nr:DNA polymerase III subunit delta [Anaerolineaceae bacterium]
MSDSSESPSFYLLRGDDSTRFRELVAGFKDALGDPDTADLNTTLLDGETLNIDSLTADVMAMPFLAPRRLVIVENARSFLTKQVKNAKDRFLKLLAELPQTTQLVLFVDDQIIKRSGKAYWENVKSYDWVLEWIGQNPSRAQVMNCSLPDVADMPVWIRRYCKDKGGTIDKSASALLAQYVGNDTLRAGHEIDKLIAYAGEGGTITTKDLVLLTTQDQEGDIFALVDALGERNGKKAMEQFLLLTEKSDVMELTGMIHRQFRLLIQAREVMDEGGRQDKVQSELKVLSFIAGKLYKQAGRFSMAQLLDIYARLLKIDEDIKTSGMPGIIAFQVLIADLTL